MDLSNMSTWKKTLIILGFIFIVVVIGYFIYFLFFQPSQPGEKPGEKGATTTPEGLPRSEEGGGQIVEPGEEPDTTPEEEPAEKIDEKAKGGITKTTPLSDSPALDPVLAKDGKSLQYYNQDDGKFYRVDEDGNIVSMSDKVFHNVDKVTWSPTKNKAILEYPDGSNIIYDFDKEEQITLPEHWQEFDFSPQGDEIVMESIGLSPDNRWLAITKDDGSGSQPIEKIGKNDDITYPSWSPNQQIIGMYTKGVDFDRQEVFFVGKNDENFKSTVVRGRGFEHQWSNQGDQLLYSVYSSDNQMKPKLWIVNSEGNKIGTGRKSLGLETWAHKCTFSSENDIYCAVPKELPEGAGLSPELAKDTKDDLYKINRETGMKQRVATPDNNHNISDLQVSEDGKYLYFKDKNTGKLQKMELK